jgi:hypothetical protein
LGRLEYRQRVPDRIAAATTLTLTLIAGRTGHLPDALRLRQVGGHAHLETLTKRWPVPGCE